MVTDKQLEPFDSSCLVVSTQHYNLFNITCTNVVIREGSRLQQRAFVPTAVGGGRGGRVRYVPIFIQGSRPKQGGVIGAHSVVRPPFNIRS